MSQAQQAVSNVHVSRLCCLACLLDICLKAAVRRPGSRPYRRCFGRERGTCWGGAPTTGHAGHRERRRRCRAGGQAKASGLLPSAKRPENEVESCGLCLTFNITLHYYCCFRQEWRRRNRPLECNAFGTALPPLSPSSLSRWACVWLL